VMGRKIFARNAIKKRGGRCRGSGLARRQGFVGFKNSGEGAIVLAAKVVYACTRAAASLATFDIVGIGP